MASISERHKAFIGEEWLKLVIDGMAKAQQTRAKQRIRRMAKALAFAFAEGESRAPDLTEEMLRVAMSLDDDDVRVLDWLCRAMQAHFQLGTGRVDHESVNDIWGHVAQHGRSMLQGGVPLTPPSLGPGNLMSACAKLQAFGLVVQMPPNPAKVPPGTTPYGPLRKGYDFVAYVRPE